MLPEVVALTGAGGKTTIMLRLAAEARAAGLRTLVTVTTKMFPPAEGPLVFDVRELDGLPYAVYARALDEPSGKLLGIDPNAIPSGFDLVLVEADGAAHKPLTAPRKDEPVIPPATTTLLAVAGLDALDQPLSAMHRPEVIASLTGLQPSDTVTPEAMAAVLANPNGNTRGLPERAKVLFILNKADDELRLLQAKQVVGLLPGPALVTVDGHVVWPLG